MDFKKIELRDDILSEAEIEELIGKIPSENLLISFRRPLKSADFLNRIVDRVAGIELDWGLENQGLVPAVDIVSLHERKPSESMSEIFERLQKLARSKQHLKLAIEIDKFAELEAGLLWQAADPTNRSFLPRSKDGRWSWARCYLKGRQKIGFLKILDGSSGDQPTPFQWLATPTTSTSHIENFAAVLGSPVFHSRSPEMHREFFAARQMPFWAIDISESEWEEAFSILQRLGMCAAAVTSPLKTAAGGVNTLWKHNSSWQKANTDGPGLKSLIENYKNKINSNPFVWGGGGTLSTIREALPEARYFSVRSGEERDKHGNLDASVSLPEWVVWAASPRADLPPDTWRPKLVVDLNYREDSAAKEFALRVGAQYVSGERMFETQATEQQKHWKKVCKEVSNER
jgi:shikimate 5-dehydrogenase